MKINPLLKWFGSSWSSAKHYPKPLPGLPLYEPFCGGAGYSLNFVDSDVTIWDSNHRLQELWCWLIYSATTQDVLDIPIDFPEGTDIRTTGLSWGQQLLIKFWQRTNSVGECWTISKWSALPGQWTGNTRARVAVQIHAVKHWKFAPPDWTQPGTWFCDPPYKFNYQYGVKNFDYAKLVDNISKIPEGSLIIASEAACKTSGKIPDYLPFVTSHSQVTSRRKTTNNHHSRELVFVQYT
jgi:hypothetical protein